MGTRDHPTFPVAVVVREVPLNALCTDVGDKERILHSKIGMEALETTRESQGEVPSIVLAFDRDERARTAWGDLLLSGKPSFCGGEHKNIALVEDPRPPLDPNAYMHFERRAAREAKNRMRIRMGIGVEHAGTSPKK